NLHAEFAFLPRKFKIALSGARNDRAKVRVHDIGLVLREVDGRSVVDVWVGGGLGRTPIIAERVREALPVADLLDYLEAILRVYNRHGRRDNKFKARIKILVDALGIDAFREEVEREWAPLRDSELKLDPYDLQRMREHFVPPPYADLPDGLAALEAPRLMDPEFDRWLRGNTVAHRQRGYAIVVLSLKNGELPPGDMTADQMDAVAALAETYGFGRLVVTHRQNLVMPDVPTTELYALWRKLRALGFATPNVDKVTDIICCPGLDYCNLANARSIPIAQALSARFAALDEVFDLGPVHLNISGCINACGHHHVGHIGILGINKTGEEYYQLMLGGSSGDDASLGQTLGRAFDRDQIIDAVETVLRTYAGLRVDDEERLLDTFRRVGPAPFQEALYGPAH
ncbi:MAG: nitrite/sulfite reductase, partial [Myxococcales bacterium]|nr:nitrite/sulfite reductase [Myxococcales bacterium]